MTILNHQILLASRPDGEASTDNFQSVETPLAPLGDGQVLVRNQFLSLDPYMRGRMNDTKSYTAPQALGAVMGGGTVGTIVDSRNPQWQVGDTVAAMLGWQDYGVSDGSDLRKVDTALAPISAYLGVLGMPGVTAWYGTPRLRPWGCRMARPKPGMSSRRLLARKSRSVSGVRSRMPNCARATTFMSGRVARRSRMSHRLRRLHGAAQRGAPGRQSPQRL